MGSNTGLLVLNYSPPARSKLPIISLSSHSSPYLSSKPSHLALVPTSPPAPPTTTNHLPTSQIIVHSYSLGTGKGFTKGESLFGFKVYISDSEDPSTVMVKNGALRPANFKLFQCTFRKEVIQ